MKKYVVLKNSDFTEGRGPMVFHDVFLNMEDLQKFCNTIECGVFGWKPTGQTWFEALWAARKELGYASKSFGGWEGYEIRVL